VQHAVFSMADGMFDRHFCHMTGNTLTICARSVLD